MVSATQCPFEISYQTTHEQKRRNKLDQNFEIVIFVIFVAFTDDDDDDSDDDINDDIDDSKLHNLRQEKHKQQLKQFVFLCLKKTFPNFLNSKKKFSELPKI